MRIEYAIDGKVFYVEREVVVEPPPWMPFDWRCKYREDIVKLLIEQSDHRFKRLQEIRDSAERWIIFESKMSEDE